MTSAAKTAEDKPSQQQIDELFEGVDPSPYGKIPLNEEATGLSKEEIARA
jgi:Ca2+-binding EF-hand superfamily protein